METIGCEDLGTLEAALQFIDECPSPALGSTDTSDASDDGAIMDSVSSFLADMDHVGDPFPAEALQPESSGCVVAKTLALRGRSSGRGTNGSAAGARRRRKTAAQEIKLLRHQELELSRKLENLQLNARSLVLTSGCSKRRAFASFWSNAAARQHEYLLHSEQENQRLRTLVAAQTRRAKRMQQTIRRLMDTTELGQATRPHLDISTSIIPPDSEAVLMRLMAEAHEIYTKVDAFLDSRSNAAYFFSYADTQIVPFDRCIVDRAVWRSVGYRVTRRSGNFFRDRVEVTDDTLATCAHLILERPNGGIYLQLRVAGRKYREAGRTVYALRALVEPQSLKDRSPLGPSFQETHVRIVTPREPAPVRRTWESPSAGSTSIDTCVTVAYSTPQERDDPFARAMWTQVVAARKLVVEDLLVDDARKLGLGSN